MYQDWFEEIPVIGDIELNEKDKNMKIEEAIKYLNSIRNNDFFNKQAIEIVLKALKYYKTHDEKYMNGELFSVKQMKFIEKEYIPKKKVEDKIEELNNEFNSYQVDVNCTQDDYYIYSDKYVFAEEKIRELLEEK